MAILPIGCLLLFWMSAFHCVLKASAQESADLPVITAGVLITGSVDWELRAMEHIRMPDEHGFQLEIKRFGSVNALQVALQGGAVDIIVSDWIWAARQSELGRSFIFAPYSTLSGAMLVADDSALRSLPDLKSERLVVAGSPEGKSWQIINAFARSEYAIDLSRYADIRYVAPPLANALLQQGAAAASLNFWHFNATLVGRGFRSLISAEEALVGLGVSADIPMLGWVFSKRFASANPQLLSTFLEASRQTKLHLVADDQVWQFLKPNMNVQDESHFLALVAAFRAGTPSKLSAKQRAEIGKLYKIIQSQSGQAEGSSFPPEIFWPGHEAP